jgi:hypothetical protein
MPVFSYPMPAMIKGVKYVYGFPLCLNDKKTQQYRLHLLSPSTGILLPSALQCLQPIAAIPERSNLTYYN